MRVKWYLPLLLTAFSFFVTTVVQAQKAQIVFEKLTHDFDATGCRINIAGGIGNDCLKR